MFSDKIRTQISSLRIPNLVIILGTIAIIFAMNIYVIAASSADTSVQRVQIIYQLSLVLAGMVGLPLAIWRSWIAHRQAITGQRQLEGFQKQISLLEAGAEADRLQKGTELLDSEKIVVRIAGIAILRSIAVQREHKFNSEAFRVINSFAKQTFSEENKKAGGNSRYVSPEDALEAFTALLDTQINTTQPIGAMTIHGARISNRHFTDDIAEVLTFRKCNFTDCTIDSDTFYTFEKTRFRRCNIQTALYDLTSYNDCTFVDCKFVGDASDEFRENNKFEGGDLLSIGLEGEKNN